MRSRWPILAILCVLAILLVPVIASASTAAGAETRVMGLELGNPTSVRVERTPTLATQQGYAPAYDDFASDSLLAARGGTYVLKNGDDVMRAGRTNDLARRAGEHARHPDSRALDFEPVHRTDNPAARRGLEQMLHDQFNPPVPRQNPIRPSMTAFGGCARGADGFTPPKRMKDVASGECAGC